MSDRWSPYDEGETKLDNYDHFFLRDDIQEVFGHPQVLEDWLVEHTPDNYCYVWFYRNRFTNDIGSNIVGQIIGVSEELAMPLKLITSIDPISNDMFERYVTYDGKHRMYSTVK